MMLQHNLCQERVVDYNSALCNSLCWIVIYLVFFSDVCFALCLLLFSLFSLFLLSILCQFSLLSFSSTFQFSYIYLSVCFLFLSYISFLSCLALLFVKLLMFPSYVCVLVVAQKKPKQNMFQPKESHVLGVSCWNCHGKTFWKEKES